MIALRHALSVELLANGRVPGLEVVLKRVGDLLEVQLHRVCNEDADLQRLDLPSAVDQQDWTGCT